MFTCFRKKAIVKEIRLIITITVIVATIGAHTLNAITNEVNLGLGLYGLNALLEQRIGSSFAQRKGTGEQSQDC
jgi:uncharacterized membrane protein